MSTVKSKKLQVGTDASASNNFTIYQPSTPDGTLRIGQGTADNPTEVGQFNANGYKPQEPVAFSAYLSSDQSLSNSTWTKIQYDTEEFDTNSNYDNATNYRFTPSVAGYYQINATNYVTLTEKTVHMSIYKNGSTFKRGVRFYADNDGGTASLQSIVSAIVYLNGSTDYVEIYGLQASGSSKNISGDQSLTYFQGILISQA